MKPTASESELVGQQDLFVNKTWGKNLMLLKYCQSLNISVKLEDSSKDEDLQSSMPRMTLQKLKTYLAEAATQKDYCDTIRNCFYQRPSPSSSGGETKEVLFRRICERVTDGLGWSRSCRCEQAGSDQATPSDHFIAAFRKPFKKGQHLALLYQQIQEVFKSSKKVYAPSVSIYQHSGSGKTKTVIELGLCVFPLLYLCFREDGTEGYPSTAASPLRKYLLFDEPSSNEAPVASQLEVYIRYAAFQVASLMLFSRFWSKTSDASGEDVGSFHGRLSVFLNAQLEGSVDERGSYLLERLHEMSKDIEVWLTKGFGNATKYFDYKNSVWKWAVVETMARQLLRSYKPSLTKAFPTDRVVGVICFDEESIFRKIYSVDQHGTKQTLSMHMLRASRLLTLLGTRCCMIRMDTTSAIDAFGPVASLKYNTSARLMEPSTQQCIYSLTSARNLGADEDFERNTDLSQTINTLSYLARFGCPLWHSMLQGNFPCLELVNFAIKKLRGGLSKTPDPIPLEYSAALFGATISIDVAPYLSLAKDLVSTHMAQLEYWFPNRNFCKVGYPPDAILAVAAAEELFSTENGTFGKHMTNFTSIIDQETVASGEVAERISRLLLLKAASNLPVEIVDAAPSMTVALFLRYLFGEENEDELRDSVSTVHPENSSGPAILDGIINLRQFVRTPSTITRSDVCLAARRGFGYICRRNAVDVDLLIPVILKRPLETFASGNAAEILSKAKAKAKARVGGKKRNQSDTTGSRKAAKYASSAAPAAPADLPAECDTTDKETGNRGGRDQDVANSAAMDIDVDDVADVASVFGRGSISAASDSSGAEAMGVVSDEARASEGGVGGEADAGHVLSTAESASVAAAAELWTLSTCDLSFAEAEGEKLHLGTNPSMWTATNGEGISLDILQGIDTAPATVQETSVVFSLMSKTDLEEKDHQFSPEYVSYIGIQVKFRSGAMDTLNSFDPLALLEPELVSSEASTMPRLALNMVFENVMSGQETGNEHYEVLLPATKTRSDPSALTSMSVVNAHRLLDPCFEKPITTLLERVGCRPPYEDWASEGNRFSVLRRPRVVETENRPVASIYL
jgi:hypothetical protein